MKLVEFHLYILEEIAYYLPQPDLLALVRTNKALYSKLIQKLNSTVILRNWEDRSSYKINLERHPEFKKYVRRMALCFDFTILSVRDDIWMLNEFENMVAMALTDWFHYDLFFDVGGYQVSNVQKKYYEKFKMPGKVGLGITLGQHIYLMLPPNLQYLHISETFLYHLKPGALSNVSTINLSTLSTIEFFDQNLETALEKLGFKSTAQNQRTLIYSPCQTVVAWQSTKFNMLRIAAKNDLMSKTK